MKVQGSYTFKADRGTVWRTLLSPDAISGCIPGSDGFEVLGSGRYDVVMKVGIGAIRGTYRAKVVVTDEDEPSSFKMAVEGSGTAGTIRGESVISLSDSDSETTVRVDGEAQVGGVVARVGQRLLGSASKMLLGQFFNCMGSRIEDEGP